MADDHAKDSTEDQAFDIAIVGAGPAGSTCAALLARSGHSVLLLDREEFPRDKVCGDGITPRGARLLARIGALEPVAEKARANDGVRLRGIGHSVTIPFTREPGRPSALLVLPRLILDQVLLEQACAAGAQFHPARKVLRIDDRADDNCCTVYCKSGEDVEVAYRARLVVVATGAATALVRQVGLLSAKPPVEHAARVYFEDIDGLDRNVTLFFDGVDAPGYGWVFPTGPRSANIGCGVFSAHAPQQAARLAQLLRDHPLLAPLTRRARQSGPIRAFSMRTDFHPDHVVRGRVAAIGEAAGLVNPITGEGIDYAFESALFLAEAIGAEGIDGAATLSASLERYRRRLARRFDGRFRVYRWIQRHCMATPDGGRFLAEFERSAALRRAVVGALFGRARLTQLLSPALFVPCLRLAWGQWRRRSDPV